MEENGYYMFIKQKRAVLEASGVELAKGWESVVELVGSEWKNLPESKKEAYQKKAEEFNEFWKKHKEEKVYLAGQDLEPYSHLQVRNLFDTKLWMDKEIVICSFNLYTDDGDLPAEIGLAAFSIRSGVVDNFGKLIDPETVPLAKTNEVMGKVKKLGIPFPGNSNGAFSDIKSLSRAVEGFLIKHRSFVERNKFCVYATDKDFKTVENCFKWIKENSGGFMPEIKVLSLPLFAYLASSKAEEIVSNGSSAFPSETQSLSTKREPGQPLTVHFRYPDQYPSLKFGKFQSDLEAEEYLESTENYRSYDVLCCVVHFNKEKGIEYCALNKVNRLAFNILEVVTMNLEVNLISGAHFPELDNPRVEHDRRLKWLHGWGISKFEASLKRATLLPFIKKKIIEESIVPAAPPSSKKVSSKKASFPSIFSKKTDLCFEEENSQTAEFYAQAVRDKRMGRGRGGSGVKRDSFI